MSAVHDTCCLWEEMEETFWQVITTYMQIRSETQQAAVHLAECITERVDWWTGQNRQKLNAEKTRLLWLATRQLRWPSLHYVWWQHCHRPPLIHLQQHPSWTSFMKYYKNRPTYNEVIIKVKRVTFFLNTVYNINHCSCCHRKINKLLCKTARLAAMICSWINTDWHLQETFILFQRVRTCEMK